MLSESTAVNETIAETLENIRSQTSYISQVVFVFHPWAEFNNIGSGRFRIQAIRNTVIPRLELIPIIAVTDTHIDSQVNPNTRKVNARFTQYTLSIANTYADLLWRYGRYGLVKLDDLSCDAAQVGRINKAFELMMEPVHESGYLEDLPRYFGVESPVADQFENPQVRLKFDAKTKIDRLVKYMEISEEDGVRLTASLPMLAASVVTAHKAALAPVDGVLSASLDQIIKGKKDRFDAVDVFLRKQFPSFNSDNRLSHSKPSSDSDAINRLADLIAQAIKQPNVVSPEILEEAKRVAPELVIPTQNGTSDAEAGIDLGEPPIETSSESLKGESALPEPLKEDQAKRPKCIAVANSGVRCKMAAEPGNGELGLQFPDFCVAHQNKQAIMTATA